MRQRVGHATAELADERFRFADADADDLMLRPIPVLVRVPDRLPLTTKLQYAAKFHLKRVHSATVKDAALEEALGTPFLFVPVFLGLGAVLYFVANAEPSAWLLAIASLSLFLIWRLRLSRGGKAWIAGALCLTALGASFAKIETAASTSVILGGEISTQAELRIRRLELQEKSVRIVADVLSTQKPVLKYAPSRVRVTLRGAPPSLKAGDIISARFGLQPPSGPVRPGGYDFAFHAWFAGIGATGFSMGKVTKLPDSPTGGRDRALFALENARMNIAAKVRAVIPGTDGAVSAALIAGVAGGIDDDTNEAMRLTGLAHILSISGLHMALVAGVFMVTLRLGFACFPAFSSRLPVKKYGAAIALLASFFYLLLSGMGVATVRSFLMLAVMLAAVLFDRQALTLRNLAISAIVILIVTPHEIMGPSFQMSFAATAALISAYSWMARRREETVSRQPERKWARTRQFLIGATVTPIVAGLATALFSAWHFHRLSPMGLPANLAAMPVVSLVVMPFGVISALAMPFGLEHWPLKIMGEGVRLMLDIARYFGSLSPEGLSGAISRPAFLVSALALTLATLLQTRLRLLGLAMAPLLLFLFANSKTPDLLVSEDARLVAYVDGAGTLAVNRAKPNAFTLQTWQRATRSSEITKPLLTGAEDAPHPSAIKAADATARSGRFSCEGGKCSLEAKDGFRVAWLALLPDQIIAEAAGADGVQPKLDIDPEYAQSVREACRKADIVIAASPTPFRRCPEGGATLLRASDMAKKGTAEVSFERTGGDAEAVTRFAVGDPVRPWNRERVFSRQARNMPEFQPRRRPLTNTPQPSQRGKAVIPPPAP